MTKAKPIWDLDSYVSCHLTNNQNIFVGKIQPKTWNFTTAGRQIIWSKVVGTIQIVLTGGSSIQLEGVALVPEYESNLILLGQLQDNKITYHDNSASMLLMQDGKPIAYVKRNRNLFVLDFAMPGQIMQVNGIANATTTTGQRRLTHLVSCSKKLRVWHGRFRHISNARIICASKLLTGMGDFSADYDPAEIYSNSEAFKSENLLIDNANLPSKKQITFKV